MISNNIPKGAEFIKGEVIVRLKGGAAGLQSTEAFSQKYGASVEDSFEFGQTGVEDQGQMLQLKLPAGMTTEQALDKMQADPTVAYAEPNFVYQLDAEVATPKLNCGFQTAQADNENQFVPNDLTSDLWGMHNVGQKGGKVDADIDAPEAWKLQTGSGNTFKIAVIDTGVDYNHPDLKANMWTNPGEIAGDGIDNDGNGVIDDVHGFNAFANSGNPMDGHGHGTHCAGTIGAVGNNELGVVGASHNAQIMAVKIFDDKGSTNTAAILRGIEYTTKMGARITSNSWGGGPASEAQKEAFAASPALHIMAAGNNGRDNDKTANFPSNYELPNIIAVAASDRNDKKASFSNFGATQVDIAAPGKDIYSCAPGGGYQFMSGTSMATPLTSGVAGLVGSQFPDASALEMKAHILNGADKLENWKGIVVDGNRLNAYGALTSAA